MPVAALCAPERRPSVVDALPIRRQSPRGYRAAFGRFCGAGAWQLRGDHWPVPIAEPLCIAIGDTQRGSGRRRSPFAGHPAEGEDGRMPTDTAMGRDQHRPTCMVGGGAPPAPEVGRAQLPSPRPIEGDDSSGTSTGGQCTTSWTRIQPAGSSEGTTSSGTSSRGDNRDSRRESHTMANGLMHRACNCRTTTTSLCHVPVWVYSSYHTGSNSPTTAARAGQEHHHNRHRAESSAPTTGVEPVCASDQLSRGLGGGLTNCGRALLRYAGGTAPGVEPSVSTGRKRRMHASGARADRFAQRDWPRSCAAPRATGRACNPTDRRRMGRRCERPRAEQGSADR